ncbi:tyrosine-type recombinase/integrase [Paramicrobacterium fandaimingii]|uniref:tyrosine-type recombinase/integrase n=1 Tax=Paramicrobacterium fandaimingii TaxID=2708079 RepID=UPI00141F27F7|nr:tyrosine-type recombinase/integrase [Microbacterium fandaimingii]
MSRPRLTIGTFGEITTRCRPSRRIEARARYRDWDGVTRLVQASGDTAAAATHALKAKCVDRNLIAPSAGSLTADSPFPDLVEYWLEDIELEDRLATATRQLYERDMRTLVLPVFKDLTLREIGVARCDQFLKRLAKDSSSKAKHARVVLRLALALAVRHEVLLRNPVDHVARLHRDVRIPDAFTSEEITAIRAAITYWEAGRDVSGPKPDGQLGAIVEVMLGTSARIGEVLAIRRSDIDLSVPSVRITGTIVSPKSEPTTRQEHPKSARSRRTIQLPGFAAHAVQRRLKQLDTIDPEALLFCSRGGTPLTTNNVRRQLLHVMGLVSIEGVTPHKFRRTVVTTINESAGVELASQLLGHTDPAITIKHYIRRNETLDPTTAGLLEGAFG